MRAKPLAVSVTPVSREIELRRHTDADGDVLTDEGVAAALELGARLRGGYQLAVSTGAQRATQTLACFLAALGEQVPGGVVVESGLRSQVEDRWRAPPTRRREAARSRHYATPTPSSSPRTPSGSASHSVASSTLWPTTAAPSSSATARRTRPPSSASPAKIVAPLAKGAVPRQRPNSRTTVLTRGSSTLKPSSLARTPTPRLRSPQPPHAELGRVLWWSLARQTSSDPMS